MKNLDGLGNLTSVHELRVVWYQASEAEVKFHRRCASQQYLQQLTNLDGLANLSTVGNFFYLVGCPTGLVWQHSQRQRSHRVKMLR